MIWLSIPIVILLWPVGLSLVNRFIRNGKDYAVSIEDSGPHRDVYDRINGKHNVDTWVRKPMGLVFMKNWVCIHPNSGGNDLQELMTEARKKADKYIAEQIEINGKRKSISYRVSMETGEPVGFKEQ